MNELIQKLYKIKKYAKILDEAGEGALIVIEGKTNGAFLKSYDSYESCYFWLPVNQWIMIEKDL